MNSEGQLTANEQEKPAAFTSPGNLQKFLAVPPGFQGEKRRGDIVFDADFESGI